MRWPKSKAELLEEEIAFLRAQVSQLQNYVVMIGPMQPQTTPFPAWNSSDNIRKEDPELEETFRLHTTEEEEDIYFAEEEGLIDKGFAERLLAAARADNHEIELS